MKKLFLVLATSLLMLFSCAGMDTTEVYEHSYRLEPLGNTGDFYLNIPNELPNFTIDYFEDSRLLPPVFETATEGILCAVYPVDSNNMYMEYYALFFHAIRGQVPNITFLAIEYQYDGNYEYWVYEDNVPRKASSEEVTAKMNDLIEVMKRKS